MGRQSLQTLLVVAIIIFGGGAVLRLTPGPEAARFGAMLAFVVAVGIAMYFIERRWPSRR
ncbi:MAG: hypothetical protein F4X25_05130 [Chloroflexi bacterium]|nr:hypothetical protein [Chloroflexota bacterium]